MICQYGINEEKIRTKLPGLIPKKGNIKLGRKQNLGFSCIYNWITRRQTSWWIIKKKVTQVMTCSSEEAFCPNLHLKQLESRAIKSCCINRHGKRSQPNEVHNHKANHYRQIKNPIIPNPKKPS